jgi:hypothetical protein
MRKLFGLATEAAAWALAWGVLFAFFYFLLGFDLTPPK